MLKILLNAGKSPNLGFAYDLFLIFISTICVKIAITWRQSVGVRRLHSSEASQRLHAGDLYYAYLVGLFEGDGFFTITKKGKYLTYELGIELSIRDVQLIYKIKNLYFIKKLLNKYNLLKNIILFLIIILFLKNLLFYNFNYILIFIIKLN